jgi:hypothetical protein
METLQQPIEMTDELRWSQFSLLLNCIESQDLSIHKAFIHALQECKNEVELKLTSALSEIERLKAKPMWVKCSERMPTEKDGIQVWVWWRGASLLWGNTPYLHHWSAVNFGSHTHWQPTGLVRPEPPKDTTK